MNRTLLQKSEMRKLQVTGGSTYIISLPKKWIAQMNLEKGSLLALVKQDNGSLLITPEELKKLEEPADAIIEVVSTDDPDSVVRKLVSTYLVGYNVIHIRAKNERLDSAQRKVIKDFTRRKLVGTEIIADSSKELVMKVLLSYPELSVQSALRRMYIITSSMHQDAITALRELDLALAHDVATMDDEVDRFSLYVIRQLKAAVANEKIIKEIGLATARDCLGYRLITKTVERTADHAVRIAENVSSLKKPIAQEVFQGIQNMSSSAISVFEDAIEALFKQDFQLADEVVKKAKKVTLMEREIIRSVSKQTGAEETSSLRLIIESIRRTAEYASDIAEIVLNLTIQDVI